MCDFKEDLVRFLEENGIQTRNYFAGNILMHPGFKELGNYKDFPNANEVLKKVFFVGCSPQYTDQHINHISETLDKWKG